MADKEKKWKVKVVGRRKGFDTSPEAAEEWLRTINELRDNAGICPRGVYRFKTFEEADKWMTEMLAESILAARRSKT